MRVRVLIFALAAVLCVVGMLGISGIPALADVCPNEQVRAESDVNPVTGVPFSIGLPECRAYEMVSPVLKNGSPVGSSVEVSGFSSVGTVARVGLEGSAVLVESKGIWPGSEQPGNSDPGDITAFSEDVQYKITRGRSGWVFKPEMPAGLREFRSALLPNPADMSTHGVWGGVSNAPSEADITGGGYANFYLLESGGNVAEIGPSKGSEAVPAFPVGASVDLSHVLFSTSSLFEYVGTGHSGEGVGAPSLVGVDNGGVLISQCGIEAGAGYESEGSQVRPSDRSGEAEERSISAGGSSVFFTAKASCGGGGTGPAVNEVFARVGQPGPGVEDGSAVTVNVAGTSECAIMAFDSCNVTKAVKYQGASVGGSKMFFTSEQPLVPDDTDSTSNLYECLLPGDSGGELTRELPVDPCPDLVRVSVPVSGGAEVQSVGAVSQDGSHVYFVAKGVLSGENAEGNSPKPGLDNLYVWDEGRTAFIATLSSAAFKFGQAQATPDGGSLVFMSSGDLVPGDTSAVSQIFLYEAQHKTLRWVSEGQGGSEDGDTTTDPASLTSRTIQEVGARIEEIALADRLGASRRVISEDGSVVVFESSAALTPQVHGGKNNVYLWRDGDLSLISDGTPAGTHHKGPTEGLVGVDASGQNVFFATEAPLVAQDSDELSDLYDARVDGGFPAPKIVECSGERCQGALSTPLAAVAPGSLSSNGAGNLMSQSPLPAPIKPKPKPLTRAEKLVKALKACAKDGAKKRVRCEALARRRYGAKSKSRKTVKSVGGRGK